MDFFYQPGLKKDFKNIIFLMFLYFIQNVPLGLAGSLSYILSSHKASYADLGTFSLAFWPFSLKLLWAPVIDSLYNKYFGRRKTWLVPIQLIIGFFMISLSDYVRSLVVNDSDQGNFDYFSNLKIKQNLIGSLYTQKFLIRFIF
jgi:PAT family acetyl-CoA transporter-like MFS transporter 1